MLTGPGPDATAIHERTWPAAGSTLRRHQSSAVIGRGAACWAEASRALLHWEVKRRSGFVVAAEPVTVGADLVINARFGPITIGEPVRVVAVVSEDDRVGFAYATRIGHPVVGEEAFIVTRDPDQTVRLELRSLTGPAPGWRRMLFPAALVLQRFYRRRYRQALHQSC